MSEAAILAAILAEQREQTRLLRVMAEGACERDSADLGRLCSRSRPWWARNRFRRGEF